MITGIAPGIESGAAIVNAAAIPIVMCAFANMKPLYHSADKESRGEYGKYDSQVSRKILYLHDASFLSVSRFFHSL